MTLLKITESVYCCTKYNDAAQVYLKEKSIFISSDYKDNKDQIKIDNKNLLLKNVLIPHSKIQDNFQRDKYILLY